MDLYIKKLRSTATAPERKTHGAAGYDLCSSDEYVIKKGKSMLVSTGIAMAIPHKTYGRIAPRSSLSCKGLFVNAGVIDSDYRGEVKVLLVNYSDSDFVVNIGDRIAQLILEKISTPDVVIVEDLDDTGRGSGGFGSTGTK